MAEAIRGKSLIFPHFSWAWVQVCFNGDLKVWERFAQCPGDPTKNCHHLPPQLGIPLVKSGQKRGQVRWWVEMIHP